MTLHAAGVPISLGGSTSGQSVNLEMGYSATANIGMNTAAIRNLAGAGANPASYSMSQFYGKSNRQTVALTISSNTTNYVLNTSKVSGYTAGICDVTLTINSGVVVGSTTTGAALIVDTSWAAGDTVKIINNGYIVGMGGAGGNGNSGAGSPGGLALQVGRATTITNNGVIGGGGGGGGAGTT